MGDMLWARVGGRHTPITAQRLPLTSAIGTFAGPLSQLCPHFIRGPLFILSVLKAGLGHPRGLLPEQHGLVVWDVLMPQAATSAWRKGRVSCSPLRMATTGLLFHRWLEEFFPKISISASYDLETILPKMGIQDAFDKSADSSGMAKRDSLQVSKVSWSVSILHESMSWKGL